MANDPRDARLIKHKDAFYVLSHSKLLMLKRMKTQTRAWLNTLVIGPCAMVDSTQVFSSDTI